ADHLGWLGRRAGKPDPVGGHDSTGKAVSAGVPQQHAEDLHVALDGGHTDLLVHHVGDPLLDVGLLDDVDAHAPDRAALDHADVPVVVLVGAVGPAAALALEPGLAMLGDARDVDATAGHSWQLWLILGDVSDALLGLEHPGLSLVGVVEGSAAFAAVGKADDAAVAARRQLLDPAHDSALRREQADDVQSLLLGELRVLHELDQLQIADELGLDPIDPFGCG